MDPTDSHPLRATVRRACPERSRRDGWTVARQLAFLDALVCTRSVTKAAAVAGMSREGAHRLLAREADGLFAALWQRALEPAPPARVEGHAHDFGNGRLMRLLGIQFRRKRGDFSAIGVARVKTRESDRTPTS